MKPTVAIIDYGMGNLFSVERACEEVGLVPQKTSDPYLIMKSDAMILPGVGAFGNAIENLKHLDLIKSLKIFIETGKPFMGICLGMQLLFSESQEFGNHKGLDVIPGVVRKFPNKNKKGEYIKIPHIGWNRIFSPHNHFHNNWKGTPLSEIKNGEYMYFVHSYFPVPDNKTLNLSVTEYENMAYCSSILYKNIVAFQFHPEKSGKEGIKIYQMWSSFITKNIRIDLI